MHNLQYVTHLNTGISHKRYRFYEKKSSRTKANCNRMQKSYSENKRPVGLYSPLTAGIMTDFVITIL